LVFIPFYLLLFSHFFVVTAQCQNQDNLLQKGRIIITKKTDLVTRGKTAYWRTAFFSIYQQTNFQTCFFLTKAGLFPRKRFPC
jgi:uncharacterized protein with PIN domain